MTYLARDVTVKKVLKEAGMALVVDYKVGTIIAKEGNVIIYKALRKGGRGQPWIVRR